MNLSGKKLTTAILAGLMGATMFGSSVFADDAQRLTNVEVLATQNKSNIDILKNDVQALKGASTKDTYSKDEVDNKLADKANQSDVTTNTNGIATNKQAISDEAKDRQTADADLQKGVDANKTAISDEKTARQDADTKLQASVDANKTVISDEKTARQDADLKLQHQIDNNSTSINDLYGRYSSLKTDINKVGARSAALAGLHPLDFDPANKLNFAVASGSFKGENSVALGAFYRPNENIMFSAASTMGDSDNAYTFGLSFKIGPSSAKTKTTSPDAEELYKVVGELQDQLAAQQKEIEQLKADKAK